MNEMNKWIFPEKIKFEHVSVYMHQFNDESHNSDLIFDLKKTDDIHSSFIGFLLHAKKQLNLKGGELKIIASDSIERIFNMMKISDYFNSTLIEEFNKKSA